MGNERLHPARSLTLRALDRVRLLKPTYRVYEAVKSARTSSDVEHVEADDLPLPPPRMRMAVAGTPEAAWFLASGRQQAAVVQQAVERHGEAMAGLGRILDFGCGCGRVIRHWAGLNGPEVHGSDYNSGLIRWCESNLRFARFSVNELRPPLTYEDGSFDLVYGISVLTHLPEDLGRAWVAELGRILKPGGLLLVTTHGEGYADRLDDDERSSYLAGEVVVRWPSTAGTNLCTTFHPQPYVRTRLAPELELLELAPERGTPGDRGQDLVVFRKS